MTSPGRKATRKPGVQIAIVVEEPAWREPDLRTILRRAARLAARRGRDGTDGTLTILLAGDETLRRLNRDFRGKDKPTNVLSFPAPANPEGHLGDIAIAHGVAAREAQQAGKPFPDHASHLVVHGVLHLLGYDHERESEASVMEPQETAILAELGIADPYAVDAAA
jgi:probable rRNA maturation factor